MTRIELANRVDALHAIIFREVKSRYAGDAIGYLWTYATPLAWIAVVYFAFVLLGRRLPIDTDVVSFILSGIVPYMAFRYGISGLIRARSSYRQLVDVMGVDRNLVYLGVSIVEAYNVLLLYSVLIAVNAITFDRLEIDDMLVSLSGMLLACLLGASFGYFVVSYSRGSETLVRAMPAVLRPTIYISGVFYTASELPSFVATALAWNPLFHAIELIRTGLFAAYESPLAIASYPALLCVVLVSLGFLRSRRAT